MALDLWFREDVARILEGLARAASRYGGEYGQGYIDALGDVAASFGLNAQDVAQGSLVRVVDAKRLPGGDGWG